MVPNGMEWELNEIGFRAVEEEEKEDDIIWMCHNIHHIKSVWQQWQPQHLPEISRVSDPFYFHLTTESSSSSSSSKSAVSLPSGSQCHLRTFWFSIEVSLVCWLVRQVITLTV